MRKCDELLANFPALATTTARSTCTPPKTLSPLHARGTFDYQICVMVNVLYTRVSHTVPALHTRYTFTTRDRKHRPPLTHSTSTSTQPQQRHQLQIAGAIPRRASLYGARDALTQPQHLRGAGGVLLPIKNLQLLIVTNNLEPRAYPAVGSATDESVDQDDSATAAAATI